MNLTIKKLNSKVRFIIERRNKDEVSEFYQGYFQTESINIARLSELQNEWKTVSYKKIGLVIVIDDYHCASKFKR